VAAVHPIMMMVMVMPLTAAATAAAASKSTAGEAVAPRHAVIKATEAVEKSRWSSTDAPAVGCMGRNRGCCDRGDGYRQSRNEGSFVHDGTPAQAFDLIRQPRQFTVQPDRRRLSRQVSSFRVHQ